MQLTYSIFNKFNWLKHYVSLFVQFKVGTEHKFWCLIVHVRIIIFSWLFRRFYHSMLCWIVSLYFEAENSLIFALRSNFVMNSDGKCHLSWHWYLLTTFIRIWSEDYGYHTQNRSPVDKTSYLKTKMNYRLDIILFRWGNHNLRILKSHQIEYNILENILRNLIWKNKEKYFLYSQNQIEGIVINSTQFNIKQKFAFHKNKFL